MELRYLSLFLVIFIFFISSCSTQTTQPTCNKPYILVGNDCCLDTDDNSICDSDETKEEAVKEPTTIQEKPKNTPPIPPTPIVTKPAYDSEVPTENELKIFL